MVVGSGVERWAQGRRQGGEPTGGDEGGARREVREAGGSDGLMLPVELRPAPGEGRRVCAVLVIPQVGKVPSDVLVGKDVAELSVNPARGRHGEGQEGIGCARSVGVGLAVPCHLGACGLMELVDIRVAQLPITYAPAPLHP